MNFLSIRLKHYYIGPITNCLIFLSISIPFPYWLMTDKMVKFHHFFFQKCLPLLAINNDCIINPVQTKHKKCSTINNVILKRKRKIFLIGWVAYFRGLLTNLQQNFNIWSIPDISEYRARWPKDVRFVSYTLSRLCRF